MNNNIIPKAAAEGQKPEFFPRRLSTFHLVRRNK